MAHPVLELMLMEFPQRLAALRKERGMTQQAMAEKIGIHVSQLKRYESGATQPTLEVFRKITLALSVSADALLFEPDERGPQTQELKLQMEAVSKLDKKEREVIRSVIDSILLMHDAKRYTRSTAAA